jgi:hypothetical protein
MADPNLLDAFTAWARSLAQRIPSQVSNVTVEICAPTSNPAVIAHFDVEEILARITFWADGSYHAEALDYATGDTTFSRHDELHDVDEIAGEFEDLLSHVGIGLTGQ